MPAGRWVGVGFVAVVIVSLAILAVLPSPDVHLTATPGRSTAGLTAPVDHAPFAQYVGVLLPGEAVDVGARTDGFVADVVVRVGESVPADFVLARIDSPSLTPADIPMAEADVRVAEAQNRQATIEVAQSRERRQRIESLSQQHLTTDEVLADGRYQEQLALSRASASDSVLAQKRASLEQRKAWAANRLVLAPFSGVVSERYIERGSRVSVGSPVVRLVRPEPLRVRFAVPAADAAHLTVGLSVHVIVDGFDRALAGEVTAVAPEIDTASQMRVAEATITASEDKDGPLRNALAGRVARVVTATASTRSLQLSSAGR